MHNIDFKYGERCKMVMQNPMQLVRSIQVNFIVDDVMHCSYPHKYNTIIVLSVFKW